MKEREREREINASSLNIMRWIDRLMDGFQTYFSI